MRKIYYCKYGPSNFCCKAQAFKDKLSSLFCQFVIDEEKRFIVTDTTMLLADNPEQLLKARALGSILQTPPIGFRQFMAPQVNDKLQKTLMLETPRCQSYKTQFTDFRNKLECFSLASLSILVKYLRVRPEPTQVKHLSGAPLQSCPRALPANIRIGWKGSTGTNTLAC